MGLNPKTGRINDEKGKYIATTSYKITRVYQNVICTAISNDQKV